MKLYFSDELYNIINRLVKYVLPALNVAILGLTKIWNLPYGNEIAATVIVIQGFLAGCMGFSTYNYNKDNKEE